MIIWNWACNQLHGLPPKQWTSRKSSQDCKELNQESQSIRSRLFSLSAKLEKDPNRGAEHLVSSVYVWTMYTKATFKEFSPLVKGETVRVMQLPCDKSQTWFKAEIEELADVRSYKVKTEDRRILCRNCRYLCRSWRPFYSSQPSEAPVAWQPPDMAASPEKLQGPLPTKGQSFPTVPLQGDQSKQSTKSPVAIPSEVQRLCTTLNKSQPVANTCRITRAGRLSKPPGYLKDYAWLQLMIVGDS